MDHPALPLGKGRGDPAGALQRHLPRQAEYDPLNRRDGEAAFGSAHQRQERPPYQPDLPDQGRTRAGGGSPTYSQPNLDGSLARCEARRGEVWAGITA